jgi:deltex-like protein
MMPFEFGDHVDENEQAIRLKDCVGHGFHLQCAEDMLEASGKCAICNKYYILKDGDMPEGTMTVNVYPAGKVPLEGHEACGTIVISYHFPSGIQGPKVSLVGWN